MALGLNKASLIGNVGNDPEFRFTKDGKEFNITKSYHQLNTFLNMNKTKFEEGVMLQFVIGTRRDHGIDTDELTIQDLNWPYMIELLDDEDSGLRIKILSDHLEDQWPLSDFSDSDIGLQLPLSMFVTIKLKFYIKAIKQNL